MNHVHLSICAIAGTTMNDDEFKYKIELSFFYYKKKPLKNTKIEISNGALIIIFMLPLNILHDHRFYHITQYAKTHCYKPETFLKQKVVGCLDRYFIHCASTDKFLIKEKQCDALCYGT